MRQYTKQAPQQRIILPKTSKELAWRNPDTDGRVTWQQSHWLWSKMSAFFLGLKETMCACLLATHCVLCSADHDHTIIWPCPAEKSEAQRRHRADSRAADPRTFHHVGGVGAFGTGGCSPFYIRCLHLHCRKHDSPALSCHLPREQDARGCGFWSSPALATPMWPHL